MANDSPGFKLTIGGAALSREGASGVVSIVVEDHVDMIGIAQATVNPAQGDWKAFKMGGDFAVNLDGDLKSPLFKGYITEIRYSFAGSRREVTVVAMDPQVKLMASRSTKVYEEQSDSDIASAVIKAAGCTTGTVDATSGTSKYVFQRNEPDLFFIKRLAARNNYMVTAHEGKINFQSVQFSGESIDFPRDQLIRLEWGVSALQITPEVKVMGWDYVEKKMVHGESKPGDVTVIGGGKNAAQAESGLLWQKTSYISDVLVSSDAGALAMAKAEYNRLARGYLRGVAVVQGNAKVRAGVKVKFTGHLEGFNAEGYVVSSRHSYDQGKYETEIHFVGNAKPA